MSDRRSFLKQFGSLITMASMPHSNLLAGNSRIIVVGGGVSGTRFSAYLKIVLPTANILMFDPVLKNNRENNYSSIQNKYRPVSREVLQEIDVDIIADKVSKIDPVEKAVYLANGKKYKADALVVAPGVDLKWNEINGFKPGMENLLKYSWQHTGDELALWHKIESMRDGSNVVVSVPEAPYRFPEGPYRRATKIADYLKKFKPGSKVLVFDSNDDFPLMHKYLEKWRTKFPPNMVEWISASNGGGQIEVNIQSNTIQLAGEVIKADVLNYIPPQQSGVVSRRAGLNVESDWCQVNPHTLESTHYKNVYVIGDANNANMYDKTAAVAEQHALQCVKSLKALLS